MIGFTKFTIAAACARLRVGEIDDDEENEFEDESNALEDKDVRNGDRTEGDEVGRRLGLGKEAAEELPFRSVLRFLLRLLLWGICMAISIGRTFGRL